MRDYGKPFQPVSILPLFLVLWLAGILEANLHAKFDVVVRVARVGAICSAGSVHAIALLSLSNTLSRLRRLHPNQFGSLVVFEKSSPGVPVRHTGKRFTNMSASAQVAVPTYSMSEFLGTIVASDKFACPTHVGRKAGNFSANGASNHITWCKDMQAAYAVQGKAPKAVKKAKPTVLEDSALRGWAGKPRTQRRDARQVESPVGQQDNTVRSKGRVRITGGYVDPATMPAGWNVDKNGREIKGKALTNRVEKLVRDGAVAVTTKAPASTPAPAPAPVATEHPDRAGVLDHAIQDIYTRLNKVEATLEHYSPMMQAIEAYAAANEDMHAAS